MLFFPNAKINLGLHIIRKRPDGFHDLETVFYPVPLYDALEVVEHPAFSFASSGQPIPGNAADNLCIKALELLKKDFPLPELAVYLYKNIPAGAGLGGGSADGAFMIRLLDQKFGLGLSIARMEEYARNLGSDCAFFIENKPVYASGKGDVFTPVSCSLKGYYLIIIKPDIHISTAEAYKNVLPADPGQRIRELIGLPVEKWRDRLRNDFEEALFPQYPVLDDIKQDFYKHGALYASMSGSGSALYGLFTEQTEMVAYRTKGWVCLSAWLQ